jgi:hypothetical protein
MQPQQQKAANIIAQKFETEYQAALKEEKFPRELVTYSWITNALAALRFASPLSLGLQPDEMVELINLRSNKEINLYQFAILSNNLESRTAHELNMTADEYCEMIIEAGQLSKEWNNITKAMRDGIVARLQAEQQAEQAEIEKVIELQNRNGLKSIPQA